METRDAASDISGTGVLKVTAGKPSSVTSGAQAQAGKRVVKLTAKALADKLDRLQNARKVKLNKASVLRKSMQALILKGDKKTNTECSWRID